MPNAYSNVEAKSIEAVVNVMKEKGMTNFDHLIKIDVIQSLLTLARSPEAFNSWIADNDNFNITNYNKEPKSSMGKYSNKIDMQSLMRRESSSSNMKDEVFGMPSSQKVVHPLSKISLSNKTFFLVLLFERKITPENFMKVLQYFQNYYPQAHDNS